MGDECGLFTLLNVLMSCFSSLSTSDWVIAGRNGLGGVEYLSVCGARHARGCGTRPSSQLGVLGPRRVFRICHAVSPAVAAEPPYNPAFWIIPRAASANGEALDSVLEAAF